MPTPTYEPIANTTVSSPVTSVTFSSLPQGFKDIVLVVNGTNSGGSQTRLRFNGDSSASYEFTSLRANTGGTGTQVFNNQTGILWDWTAPMEEMAMSVGTIFDYSSSDKNKMVLNKAGTYYGVGLQGNRWRNNSAINSITIYVNGGSFFTGTTFALYGLVG